jgi:uncharacterized protein involved in exopolysaccharide biosynthesis
MAQCRLQSARLALLAGLLGALLLAPAPRARALAEPIDSQENSLESAVDSFIAYLRTETNEAIIAAARAAREHKDSIEAAKARLGAALDELSQALGGPKGTLERFGKNAAAMSEAWREAAASSWAKIESSARDVLAELETWLRRHSPPEENPEIPV